MAKKKVSSNKNTESDLTPKEGANVTSQSNEGVKVEVEKSDLQKMMEKIEDQGKTIELLLKSADKARLAKAQANENGEPLIKTVRVRKYDPEGKLVVGWKLTSNVCEIVNGRWVEEQRCMMMFNDNTTKEVPLLDFYRKMSDEVAEILSRRTEVTDKGEQKEYVKLKLVESGEELEMGIQFVN